MFVVWRWNSRFSNQHANSLREVVAAAEGSEFKRSRIVLDGDRQKPKALPIGLEKQLGLTAIKLSLDELGGTGNAECFPELYLRGRNSAPLRKRRIHGAASR